MTYRLCADPACPDAWAEHEAHDDKPSTVPATRSCTDPGCPMRGYEHDAH